MAKEELLSFEGKIEEILPDGRFARARELTDRCRSLLLEHGHDVVSEAGQGTTAVLSLPHGIPSVGTVVVAATASDVDVGATELGVAPVPPKLSSLNSVPSACQTW